jgi:hypothetical protein
MDIEKGGVLMSQELFDNIEKKTGVNKKEIFGLVDQLKSANLQDEKTVRRMIHQVSKLANKPVSKQVEDNLVHSIMNNNLPADLSSLSKMLGSK